MPAPYPSTGPVTLKTNLADSALSAALKSGRISSSIVRFDFCGPPVASNGFKAMVREGAFDAGELAIVTFLQAKTYGKPLTLLPATVVGRFQHNTMSYMDRGKPLTPKDLEGRRVAVRAYTQTTGAWARGILQHEYGVDLSRITWVTTDDPHLAEFTDPEQCGAGRQEREAARPASDRWRSRRRHPRSGRSQARNRASADCRSCRGGSGLVREVRLHPHQPHVRAQFRSGTTAAGRGGRGVSDAGREQGGRRSAQGHRCAAVWRSNVARSIEIIGQYANEQGIIPRPFAVSELFDETTRSLGA